MNSSLTLCRDINRSPQAQLVCIRLLAFPAPSLTTLTLQHLNTDQQHMINLPKPPQQYENRYMTGHFNNFVLSKLPMQAQYYELRFIINHLQTV